MRKLIQLTGLMLALLVALGSSSGGDDDDDDDIVITPDANTGSNPDAATTGNPDAAPSVSAANLGKPCASDTECGVGGTCAGLEAMATQGICTIVCPTQGEEGPCGASNGFPGPGVGYCALSDGMSPPTFYCAVGCGEQNGGDNSCPTGTTCKDLINGNGQGDLCAP